MRGWVDEKRRDNWSVQADGDVYKWALSSCLLVLSCAAVEVAALLFVAPPRAAVTTATSGIICSLILHHPINHPSYQMNSAKSATRLRRKKKNLKMHNCTSLQTVKRTIKVQVPK